jgi:hypothetical protein
MLHNIQPLIATIARKLVRCDSLFALWLGTALVSGLHFTTLVALKI